MHDGRKRLQWLPNRVGFVGQAHTPGQARPSTQWPIQGFSWTDHEVSAGDRARYRVVPVVRDESGKLRRRDDLASAWAPAPDPQPDATFRPFFNRGFVISQFVARYLLETGKTLAQFKATISDENDKTIRRFLSGDLRVAMLERLAKATADGSHVYAALFELSDAELVDALCALGSRAHLVLSNGSIQHRTGGSLAQERKDDENSTARARLIAAGVDVASADRFISPGALGHNKFLVETDGAGTATAAWTGSTNWTPTGLCTQLNNGLLIRDAAIAGHYLEQWHRLRAAGSAFPASLVSANTTPKSTPDTTVWFTRTKGKVDLAALRAEIDGAKQAILFLMFMPGAKGPLADVMRREKEPGLFVRGVVSELPKGLTDESVADVTIVGDGKPYSRRFDVIQPEGIPNAVAFWAAEVTHSQFLKNIGFAIVHSKVLLIDPFSDAPTVITGSHNFSDSASGENDENFVVVRGQRDLAQAYLVNIIGAWRHYRARAKATTVYAGLRDDDTWMRGSLAARRRQASFWGF